MSTRVEIINNETIGVTFPYDAQAVAAIKRLQNRRWNAKKGRWEIHISQLADVVRILHLKPADVGEQVLAIYRAGWVRTKLKVVLGPLEGRLAGSGAPLGEIDQATSFFVPGYKYSEMYQSRKWDGKRHLFRWKGQVFPAGLWPRVRAILDAHELKYEVVEKAAEERKASETDENGREDNYEHEHEPKTSRNLQSSIINQKSLTPLRDYQAAAARSALEARRGIIQMATGGGKTLLAAHLIRQVGRPCFFFVHTLDLLYQAAEVFQRELGIEIGLLGDGQASLRDVTVATIQTAGRAFGEAMPRPRRKKELLDEEEELELRERLTNLDEATRRQVCEAIEAAGLVIFDECHHVPADRFYKIAMRTRSARWRFGLSATPWRDDGHDLLLEAALGAKVHETKSSDLIERGWLVPPRIRMVPAPGPKIHGKGWTYADLYQTAIVENQERNRAIATQARRWAEEGASVLILVAQVAHGQRLAELLPEAHFVYGALETALRQQYLGELEQKLRPVMIATTLADEGLDIPTLDGVILGGGGKSQTRAYQRIGRALRPAPGKLEARVLDFLDQAPYLREHSQARLALYRQEPRFLVECEG